MALRVRFGQLALACLIVWRQGDAQANPKYKGICYTPDPMKSQAFGEFSQDDYMAPIAQPLWGPRGRGDLGIMKQMGATVVRTYGNNPKNDHRAFLDEVLAQGMHVIPGLSDYPYTQMDGACINNNFDCYNDVKAYYLQNLANGFLLENGTYHPAIAHLIIVNEPDRILPGIDEPLHFGKGVISAIDGLLDAEKEMNVTGKLINFTATMTFKFCPACTQHPELGGTPGLRQMLEVYNAMMHPEQYGYTPKNDLAELYRTRYFHSFNTQSAAWAVKNEFVPVYETMFPDTPFYVEEYHVADLDVNWNQTAAQQKDLADAMNLLETTSLLLGVSFFEYQVSIFKKHWEHQFGMFALGNFSIDQVDMFGVPVHIWCLVPSEWRGVHMPPLVAAAYGGSIDMSTMCLPDPLKVKLNQEGFKQIRSLNSAEDMAVFIRRAVEHLGGNVLYDRGLQEFAARFGVAATLGMSAAQAAGDQDQDQEQHVDDDRRLSSLVPVSKTTFLDMLDELRRHPKWAVWDESPACVADRLSNTDAVGQVIATLCMKMHWFNCSRIPQDCKTDAWQTGDYVFSAYAQERIAEAPKGSQVNPLDICYFNGTALYASASYYAFAHADHTCVVNTDPHTTAMTDEGYHAVLGTSDASANAMFLERYVRDELKANVTDMDKLRKLASPDSPPPDTLDQLRTVLREASWVCGGEALLKSCVETEETPMQWLMHLGWTWITLGSLAGLCIVACCITCIYVASSSDESDDWAKRNMEYTVRLRDEVRRTITAEANGSHSVVSENSWKSRGVRDPQLNLSPQQLALSQLAPQHLAPPQPVQTMPVAMYQPVAQPRMQIHPGAAIPMSRV